MSIVKKAVQESRDVARLAVDAAKNELIEQLTPSIKAIIDASLRRGTLGEDVERLSGTNTTELEEGTNMKKTGKKATKAESVASLFPGIREAACDGDDDGHADMKEDADMEGDGMAEAHEDDTGYDDLGTKTTGEEPDIAETLELSESELEEMYAEALQLEVEVTKGFKDMEKPHGLGAGAKPEYENDPNNVMDYEKSEAEWDNIAPSDTKDFIPREGVSPRVARAIKQGVRENNALAKQNARLTEMVRLMHGKLSEMNLLNTKILHVNRFMAAHRLTNEQKRAVIEGIDKGTTVNEVKRIHSVLESSFRAAGAIVNEGVRRPHADSQKARTSGSPNAKVLRESVDKNEGSGSARWRQLAGLKKLTNG